MELYEQIELQECPICGGAGLMEEENGWCFYAACLDCGAHTAELRYERDAERLDAAQRAAHRLLRQAAQLYAPGLAEPALASGAHGKPYFPDAPQLQFSISHSGAYWLCAFSAAPVGLDVQQHRDCQKQALARRFFSPAEQAFLERTSHAPFFDLWCAKESYLKFTGEGISGLEAVCTVSPEGGFPSVPGVNLQLLPLFAGYSACLCTASPAEIREQFL